MLTAAVRDLHLTFPGEYLTDVRTSEQALWENNPYLTPLSESDPDVEVVECHYPLIDESNRLPYHFIHGFRLFLSDYLGRRIKPLAFKGDLHLSDVERELPAELQEAIGGPDVPYWIVVCGGKTDFTCKWWDPARYQAMVDHFRGRLVFVQCAAVGLGYVHWPLNGVVDLVGRTPMRLLLRLMHRAAGVVCPVTLAMHLAAAVETPPGRPPNRPCVVVAGGREPSQFITYPFHQVLHTNGALPCCDAGGCWKSRVARLGDGDPKDRDLCSFPAALSSGALLPRCMDLIRAEHVIGAVERHVEFERLRKEVGAGCGGQTGEGGEL